MYKWNGLSLKLPSELICESVLSFVDNVEEPTYGVTIAREQTTESISEYLKVVIDELKTLIEDFKLNETSVKDALGVLDFSYPDEDGIQRQRQHYRRVGKELVITSVTAGIANFDKAKAALEELEISESK